MDKYEPQHGINWKGRLEVSNDLFDVSEQLSPRLKWMKDNGVCTFRCINLDPEELSWFAWRGTREDAMHEDACGRSGMGETEDDALVDFCKKMGIKLWNE